MKKAAYFFFVLFTGFLITPSLVTYIDESVDISMAYTSNEEENSPQTQVVYDRDNSQSEDLKLHFLQEESALSHYYHMGERLVFLEVLSPPPKQA